MKRTNQWVIAAILSLCGTLSIQAQTTESDRSKDQSGHNRVPVEYPHYH